MRILWQSFLNPRAHGAYVELLRGHLAQVVPEAEFDVVGMDPPDRHLHALTELRCGLIAIRNAVWADRAGYDAVVLGHFQEPGLHEARCAVELPVVGLGEAALLHGCTLGRKLGLVTIDPVFVPWHEEQVLRLGLERRVVGVRSLDLAPDRFMAAMEPGPVRNDLLARLEAQAGPLLEAGADVIVPAGGLPALALCSGGPCTVGGAEVLNVVAVAAVQARAAIALRAAGTCVSRRGAFGRVPPAALGEFLEATGGDLETPLR